MKSIRYEVSKQNTRMATTHFHEHLEIYYQVKGEKDYFIEDKTYRILPGDLVIISENVIHKAFASGLKESERILIELDRAYIKKSINGIKLDFLFEPFDNKVFVLRLVTTYQNEVDRLIKEIGKIFDSSVEKSHWDHSRRLSLLIKTIELLTFIQLHFDKQENLVLHNLNGTNGHIDKITQFLCEHYMENQSLDKIADRFGVNKYYMCKLFKQTTGFTFTEYLNLLRVKEACKLLQTTSMDVTSISEVVGFNDISYFGKVFKKIMKQSPLNFKKSGAKL